ncbi:substrate-binding domain-containing protein [Rhizobium sp.]|uniref:substrate-binding domain-containing protein n=1 Tax=Rhizobium sp. TaxID=391 RepID=UPI0039181F1A
MKSVIDHSIEASVHAMDELMAQDDAPSAIFATSDLTALAALRWAAKSNFKVPEELAIVGFDDTDYVAQATTPVSSTSSNLRRRQWNASCSSLPTRSCCRPQSHEPHLGALSSARAHSIRSPGGTGSFAGQLRYGALNPIISIKRDR